jgi:ATP phosphoribosyltransferase
VLFESTTRFIANREAWKDPFKRKKMENLVLLLQGALAAEEKVGLKMNVQEKSMTRVMSLLPSINSPTVSQLAEGGWFDIDTIIDEKIVRDLIPKLKEAGATGIVEYPLNKVIP